MFKTLTLAAGALIAAATLTPTAATAQGYSQGGGYYQPVQYRYRPGDYYGRRGYRQERRAHRRAYNRHYGRGYGGRGYCRDSGTGGTILGAIAGGLLGAEIADGGRYHRGDEAAGAIVGAGVGALAGRAIDRDC